jgi:hypothetical protein
MNRKSICAAILSATCLMLVSGCSPGPVGSDAGKKPVPADLKSFESNGEGLSEVPLTPDWVKAQMILDQAKTTWSTLKPTLKLDGAKVAQLDAIDAQLAKYAADVTAKSVRAAETDANAISLIVPDFFDLYDFPVPSDALRLDGEYRLTQIQGEYSDWAPAAAEFTKAQAIWTRMKTNVKAKVPSRTDVMGSASVVADVDQNLIALTAAITAKDSAKVISLAKTGLDLVDVVEQLFE